MLSANQIPGFLNQLLLNKSIKQPHVLYAATNSQKIEVDQKSFWLGMIKNGCGQSGLKN